MIEFLIPGNLHGYDDCRDVEFRRFKSMRTRSDLLNNVKMLM
jgi:hypothetical protein